MKLKNGELIEHYYSMCQLDEINVMLLMELPLTVYMTYNEKMEKHYEVSQCHEDNWIMLEVEKVNIPDGSVSTINDPIRRVSYSDTPKEWHIGNGNASLWMEN